MRGEKTAKLPAGPMSFVMPGPMFDRQLSEAVKQVAELAPDVVVLDLMMPMLNGADAKTVKDMFAEAGYELSEEDIAKVSNGVIANLAKLPEMERELADEELEQVAGGTSCQKPGGGVE